jgi:hypothetical protein
MKFLESLVAEFHDAVMDVPPLKEHDSRLIFRCTLIDGSTTGVQIEGFKEFGYSVSGGYPPYGVNAFFEFSRDSEVKWLSGNFETNLYFVGSAPTWNLVATPEVDLVHDTRLNLEHRQAFEEIKTFNVVQIDEDLSRLTFLKRVKPFGSLKKVMSLDDFLAKHNLELQGEPLVDHYKQESISKCKFAWVTGTFEAISIEGPNLRLLFPVKMAV